jgi:hypothetical protein
MGYTTYFNGEFTVTPKLNDGQVAYLKAFNNTRRMKRDEAIAETFPDPVRWDAQIKTVGEEGEYYVGAAGSDYGQENDPSVKDHNEPPADQPGLWCQWVPSDDGTTIAWDDGEKFYNYVAWLEYIVEHFLEPWGRKLNGEVHYTGEDSEDRGTIYVQDNVIKDVVDTIINKNPFSV